MSQNVNPEIVTKIAHLSKLALTESETEQMVSQIEKFLEYVDQLNELKTELEPLENITGLENVWREDKVVVCDQAEKIVSNSPKNRDGFFLVPKVLE